MSRSARVVAFLRGINVGTAKQVDMARLRTLLAELGYTDIATLLRSGNAVFTCEARQLDSVASDIEDAIVREFAFESKVITRTARELLSAIGADPLTQIADDGSKHFVGFLSQPAVAGRVKTLRSEDLGSDVLEVRGKHVYMWCPNGLSRGPAGRLNLERILGVAVTLRNWNTVTKLAEMTAATAP